MSNKREKQWVILGADFAEINKFKERLTFIKWSLKEGILCLLMLLDKWAFLLMVSLLILLLQKIWRVNLLRLLVISCHIKRLKVCSTEEILIVRARIQEPSFIVVVSKYTGSGRVSGYDCRLLVDLR